MWQVLIDIGKEWEKSYKYIINRLRSRSGISYAVENTASRYIIHVASEHYMKHVIDDILADTILMHFKHEYLTSKIRFNNTSGLNIALLSALIYCDKAHEKSVIISKLKDIKEYSVDGIYLFRLKEIVENWQEIVDLVNAMLYANHSPSDIYSLIDFILEMSEDNKTKLKIYKSDEDIVIENIDDETKIEIPDLSDIANINIMTAVLSANPGKLYIDSTVLSNELEGILYNIVDSSPILM